MFAVISCKKYVPRTLRVADLGVNDPVSTLSNLPPMECPICGTFSHVELSWGSGMLEVHSEHQGLEEATEAAIELTEAMPGKYSFELPADHKSKSKAVSS